MYGSYSYVPPPQLREQSESDASESDVEDGSNVYYTGMDPNATKDYVIGIFNKFGAVSDVKILIGTRAWTHLPAHVRRPLC